MSLKDSTTPHADDNSASVEQKYKLIVKLNNNNNNNEEDDSSINVATVQYYREISQIKCCCLLYFCKRSYKDLLIKNCMITGCNPPPAITPTLSFSLPLLKYNVLGLWTPKVTETPRRRRQLPPTYVGLLNKNNNFADVLNVADKTQTQSLNENLKNNSMENAENSLLHLCKEKPKSCKLPQDRQTTKSKSQKQNQIQNQKQQKQSEVQTQTQIQKQIHTHRKKQFNKNRTSLFTYFILKITQLCIIIIFMMPTTATTTAVTTTTRTTMASRAETTKMLTPLITAATTTATTTNATNTAYKVPLQNYNLITTTSTETKFRRRRRKAEEDVDVENRKSNTRKKNILKALVTKTKIKINENEHSQFYYSRLKNSKLSFISENSFINRKYSQSKHSNSKIIEQSQSEKTTIEQINKNTKLQQQKRPPAKSLKLTLSEIINKNSKSKSNSSEYNLQKFVNTTKSQHSTHNHNSSHIAIAATFQQNQDNTLNTLDISSLKQQQIRPSSRDDYLRHNDNDNSNDNNINHRNSTIDLTKLSEMVLKGLGLSTLPDMKKANISQREYTNKYLEYLARVHRHQQRDDFHKFTTVDNISDINYESSGSDLHLLSIAMKQSVDITDERWRHKRKRRDAELPSDLSVGVPHRRRRKLRHSKAKKLASGGDKMNILLQFPLKGNDAEQIHADSVEEANIRLMLMYSPALATPSLSSKKTTKRRKNKNFDGKKTQSGAPSHPCNDEQEEKTTMQKNQNQNQNQNPLKSSQNHSHVLALNLKVFHLLSGGVGKRDLQDARRIEFESKAAASEHDETRSQWLEFDVIKAVKLSLKAHHENLSIEVQCGNCKRIGARILDATISTSNPDFAEDEPLQLGPVLNIVGREIGLNRQLHAIENKNNNDEDQHRATSVEKHYSRNSCYKPRQRCCRRRLNVVFKEIKGFEFILQPKVFDAGYCQGRCPPRHNPAHHHALLQSLIWKQDHRRAPRPCCTPSKLVPLEVLHVDENDSKKLKISTWSDMQVVECACS